MAFQAVKKSFQNLEDFLDNPPTSPCVDQPDRGKYCSVCMRLNETVAIDCEYIEMSEEKKVAQKSTFKIVGQSADDRPKFNILGAREEEPVVDKKPIAGIEKEYPLIEIVKPEDPKIKPLEMELIEEETVVFGIADDDEVKMQESEEGLTNMIVQVQPLLSKAAALGLDMTSIQSKLREGVKLLGDKDFEKAQALLKGLDSALMMDSILFTQNKLEEVVAKKPNEKTLPRYFTEAGNRFKNKDYAKCLDYLKYVVDQSTRMIKQIEELEKAKKELEAEEEEEVEVMAVEIMDDDDDDDVVKIEVVSGDDVGEVRTLKVKGVKKKGKKKGKGVKKKRGKAKKKPKGVKKMKGKKKGKGAKKKKKKGKKKAKGSVKQLKVKTPKAKKEIKVEKKPEFEVKKMKTKGPKKGPPPKFKPVKENKSSEQVHSFLKDKSSKKADKPIKVKKPAPKKELEELKPIQKPPDMRLRALMSAQKAAERYATKKEELEQAREAGEDVVGQEAGLQAVEMSIAKARELLAQERYDEMIVLSDQILKMLE